MTLGKRKSSLPESPAKCPKLKKESERRSVASKKKDVITSKSKTSHKKKAPKAATTKAIKNSKISRPQVGQKRGTVTKKSAASNVPAKGRVLPGAKEGASARRGVQKSANTPTKSQSRVSKAVARRSSVQNKSNKVTGKALANRNVKQVSCAKKSVATKMKDKTSTKSARGKGNLRNRSSGTENKSVQNKANKNDSQAKRAQNPDKKRVSKTPKLKPESRQAASGAQRASSTRRTSSKALQPGSQRPANLPGAKKKLGENKQGNVKKMVSKKSGVRTEKKIENKAAKKCLKDTKKISPVIHSEKSKTQSDGTKEKGSEASCTSNPGCSSIDVSDTLTKKKATAPVKRKRNSTNPLDSTAKKKAKKVKVTKSEASHKEPDENGQNAKRLSILDLCNEIAGEIESDTVEVVKEGPSSPTPYSEQEQAQSLEVPSPPTATESPVSESKRFFPSRKPLQIKRKLEQKTSPGARNSKWKKIKFKNSFAQNNLLLRKRLALPSVEVITARVPQGRQPASGGHSSPCNKKADAKSGKPVVFERAKNNTTAAALKKNSAQNCLLGNHIKHELEAAIDEGFRLHLDSSPENSPMKKPSASSPSELKPTGKRQSGDVKQLTGQMAARAESGCMEKNNSHQANTNTPASGASIQKEIRKLKDADKDGTKQPIIDAGQKRFGAMSCSVCGMLYTASNPEDEAQHLLFHNQFISAVKYVGWKKERTVAEYPDGKIIMVLPDDPKYALKKVQEIREMVDNDLGFQQVPLRLHSRTKTFLFISSDKKIVGCLIAEHIQWGYRVVDDFNPGEFSDAEKLFSERVKAWCCATTPEPAICGVSRIWVFSMMRRKKIASRLLECLRNQFIYGSHLSKGEIAFSDPTPDGKLFATHYCGTSQFLVYNFVSGHNPLS
ncbi:N-acetyltransferase ESCO1 [Gastrophryne carolinensis]